MCWSHKIHPFFYTTGFIQQTPPVSQESSNYYMEKEKAGEEGHSSPVLLKMFHCMKKLSRNKKGGGKKAENALWLNGLAFTCWKNTIFLFAAIEANSVYFVLKDC